MLRLQSCFCVVILMTLAPVICSGQGGGNGGGNQGGGGTGGNNQGGGDTGIPPTGLPTGTNLGGAGGTAGGATAGDGQSVGASQVNTLEAFDVESALPRTEIANERIQPFVGPSIARFSEQQLAHPRSLLDPGSSGGGGGGGGAGARGGQANRGVGAGAQNGFEVARFGLRSRLIVSFAPAQVITGAQVSSRFQQRLSRIPGMSSYTDDLQVTITGTTAVLTGRVPTPEARQSVERMARLEPGIYQIVNQLQVAN